MVRASVAASSATRDLCTNGDDIRLLRPSDDVSNPEISIVIPALNEELTIAQFVEWCHEGLRRANVKGEILIIDSSSDRTAEIALSKGARVLKVPKRGLGRAYIDALPFIRGDYVLMGDADCTYDFRDLEPFVKSLRSGYEYVMGSRFRGYIEPGSMPRLHRYLGTPVTTWLLNVLYRSRFSDIHCGMRGITREGLARMDLQSQSWEYASEMVLKSVRMGLRTAEVPVRFLKDQEGRLSHHKRAGWFSPWAAAWINMKAMFIYGTDFFVLRPGFILFLLGLLLTLPLAAGPVAVGPITFSLHAPASSRMRRQSCTHPAAESTEISAKGKPTKTLVLSCPFPRMAPANWRARRLLARTAICSSSPAALFASEMLSARGKRMEWASIFSVNC